MGKRWKTYERRVATFFGVHRTPLSGGASRHTRSDTLHPKLFIEAKSVSGDSGTNRWIWKWLKELDYPKYPVRVSGLYLFPSKCFGTDYPQPVRAGGVPNQALQLWVQTSAFALEENKVPLVALFVKGKRDFWLLGAAGALLKAMYYRERVKGK